MKFKVGLSLFNGATRFIFRFEIVFWNDFEVWTKTRDWNETAFKQIWAIV